MGYCQRFAGRPVVSEGPALDGTGAKRARVLSDPSFMLTVIGH